VSRDKILHDYWSISAALARGFSDRHFERGEGPGDEVGEETEQVLEQTEDAKIAVSTTCYWPPGGMIASCGHFRNE